jgi:hypothetical protein
MEKRKLTILVIDDEQIVRVTETIEVRVIDEAAVLIRNERVLGLPGLESFAIVRQHVLQKWNLAPAFDAEPKEQQKAVERTIKWAKICKETHSNNQQLLQLLSKTGVVIEFCRIVQSVSVER